MPRRNNRDRRFEPKVYETENQRDSYYDYPSQKQKPTRRRKGKWDKKIYRDDE